MEGTSNRQGDEGTAYGRAPQQHDAEITEVGAGHAVRRVHAPLLASGRARPSASGRGRRTCASSAKT